MNLKSCYGCDGTRWIMKSGQGRRERVPCPECTTVNAQAHFEAKPALAEVVGIGRVRDAKETLQKIIEDHGDTMNHVIVLIGHNDGGRSLITSNASHEEKSLLKCFFDHWVLKWFERDA